MPMAPAGTPKQQCGIDSRIWVRKCGPKVVPSHRHFSKKMTKIFAGKPRIAAKKDPTSVPKSSVRSVRFSTLDQKIGKKLVENRESRWEHDPIRSKKLPCPGDDFKVFPKNRLFLQFAKNVPMTCCKKAVPKTRSQGRIFVNCWKQQIFGSCEMTNRGGVGPKNGRKSCATPVFSGILVNFLWDLSWIWGAFSVPKNADFYEEHGKIWIPKKTQNREKKDSY